MRARKRAGRHHRHTDSTASLRLEGILEEHTARRHSQTAENQIAGVRCHAHSEGWRVRSELTSAISKPRKIQFSLCGRLHLTLAHSCGKRRPGDSFAPLSEEM